MTNGVAKSEAYLSFSAFTTAVEPRRQMVAAAAAAVPTMFLSHMLNIGQIKNTLMSKKNRVRC